VFLAPLSLGEGLDFAGDVEDALAAWELGVEEVFAFGDVEVVEAGNL